MLTYDDLPVGSSITGCIDITREEWIAAISKANLSEGERVRFGASVLDRAVPDWFRRIDLSTFSITECSLCVMGQVTGNYNPEKERPNITIDGKTAPYFLPWGCRSERLDAMRGMGFAITGNVYHEDEIEICDLERYWAHEVTSRLIAARTATQE